MNLTYSRHTSTQRGWDVSSEAFVHTFTVVLTIRLDGVPVGTARTSTVWKSGRTFGYRSRKWTGRKWSNDWELDIAGRK